MTPPSAGPPNLQGFGGDSPPLRPACCQPQRCTSSAHCSSANSPATLSFELRPPSSCKQATALLKIAPPCGAVPSRQQCLPGNTQLQSHGTKWRRRLACYFAVASGERGGAKHHQGCQLVPLLAGVHGRRHCLLVATRPAPLPLHPADGLQSQLQRGCRSRYDSTRRHLRCLIDATCLQHSRQMLLAL